MLNVVEWTRAWLSLGTFMAMIHSSTFVEQPMSAAAVQQLLTVENKYSTC